LKDLGTGKDEMASVMVITSLILSEIGSPEYSSTKSKRTFSDHCKIGLLILKEWMDVSYRDLCRRLWSMPGVMTAGKMKSVPEPSTLRKFAKRVPSDLLDKVIAETARMLCGPDVIAPMDATGMSMSNASRHYVKRLKMIGTVVTTVKNYAKVTLLGDIGSKAVISCDVVISNTADVKRAIPVLKKAKDTEVAIKNILADKGYDSEQLHREGRAIFGNDIDIWIPVRMQEPKSKRSADKWQPGGTHRKIMYRSIDESPYSYRAIIETINSMIKRKMGDMIYGKTVFTVKKEVQFTVISHNMRLLLESGWVI
jgi:hypothetical protein